MSDDETRKMKTIGGIIAGLFLIYLVASASGIVPEGYNIFRGGEKLITPPLPSGSGYVDGFPEVVNITEQMNNSYLITFACNESYISGMELIITPGEDLVNTTTYWTATSTDWVISINGLTATYYGSALSANVEVATLRLHVNGGEVEDIITIDVNTTVGELDEDSFEILVVL